MISREMVKVAALLVTGAFLGVLIRNLRWIDSPDVEMLASLGGVAVWAWALWIAVVRRDRGKP